MPQQPTAAEPTRLAACGFRATVALAAALLAASPAPAEDTAPAKAGDAAQKADARKTAIERLDEQYVLGPTAADAFGFRIVWQTPSLATPSAKTQVVSVDADSVWFGDSAGSVVRLARSNGEKVWRGSTFQGLERMLAIEHLPKGANDFVYVVTEVNCVTLDAVTGGLKRRNGFAQLPGTTPTVFSDYMVWGTRGGLVTWYQYGTGYNWRSTTIGGSMSAAPTIRDGVVMAGSSQGTVLALDAGSTRVIWSRKLAGAVEAPIAMDDRSAFVASRDQSLWAFDLQRGRVMWQYFTQAPLANEPVAIAGGLYLQIPDQGLVSFNPHPDGKPDGEVRWKSTAAGTVIGRLGTNLLAWDRATRTMTTVDVGNGRIVETRTLPQVEWISVAPKLNGDLWVASEDGRVEHLEPLARPTMAEETAKPAPEAKATLPGAPKPATDAAQGGAGGGDAAPAADGNGMRAGARPTR